MLMGKQLAGLPGEIVGIPIAWSAAKVREHIGRTMATAIQRFGFAIEVPKTFHLIDGYQGTGRASVEEAELSTIVRLARDEGIVLDPVYTAKAFAGLVTTLEKDPKALGHRICFIHTGGIFSLFPFRESLTRMLDAS